MHRMDDIKNGKDQYVYKTSFSQIDSNFSKKYNLLELFVETLSLFVNKTIHSIFQFKTSKKIIY